MGETNRLVTTEDLANEAKKHRECLSQTRLWCVNIRNAGRFLGQSFDTDAFATKTWDEFFVLRRRCSECPNLSAVGFITFANAGTSPPIRFDDWTAATAHQVACQLLQDAILHYDPITCWDEHGERRGYLYTEVERIRDCRQLVEWADKVTDELIEDIDVRIGMECDVAARRLIDQENATKLSADSADNKKLFPNGVPDDVNVVALAVLIHEEQGKPKKERRRNKQIARDYVGKTGLNPESLLRQVRRYTE